MPIRAIKHASMSKHDLTAASLAPMSVQGFFRHYSATMKLHEWIVDPCVSYISRSPLVNTVDPCIINFLFT